MSTIFNANLLERTKPTIVCIANDYETMDLNEIVTLFRNDEGWDDFWQLFIDHTGPFPSSQAGRPEKALYTQCVLSWYVRSCEGSLLRALLQTRPTFQAYDFNTLPLPYSGTSKDSYYAFMFGKYVLLSLNQMSHIDYSLTRDVVALFGRKNDRDHEDELRNLKKDCWILLDDLSSRQHEDVCHVVYKAVKEWLRQYPNQHEGPAGLIYDRLKTSLMGDQMAEEWLLESVLDKCQRFDLAHLAACFTSDPVDAAMAVSTFRKEVSRVCLQPEVCHGLLFASMFSWYHNYFYVDEDIPQLAVQMFNNLASAHIQAIEGSPVPYDNVQEDPLYQIVYGCYLKARLGDGGMPAYLLAKIVYKHGSGVEKDHAQMFLTWQERIEERMKAIKRSSDGDGAVVKGLPGIVEACEQWLTSTPRIRLTLLYLQGSAVSRYWRSRGLPNHLRFELDNFGMRTSVDRPSNFP